LDGLGDLVEQGLVPELGLSNVGPKRLRFLHGHLLNRGIRLQSVQVQLSLLASEPIFNGQLAQVCRELDVELLAYSPLALGILAIPPGVKGTTSTVLRSRLFQRLLPASEDLRSVMVEIASQRSASMAQVALNWCRAHGACPIPGLRRPVQAHDAAKALCWSLSDIERQALDQLSQRTLARMPANPFQSA
jgi:pyridoxine 4-dehydrogenase